MSNKLKIYACSGIGNADGDNAYSYWTDNTSLQQNTQIVNQIFAEINLLATEVTYLQLNKSEIQERLDKIDYYVLILFYVQDYADNIEELRRAGEVIGEMLARGYFYYESIDNLERDAHLDELFEIANTLMQSNAEYNNVIAEFIDWWNTYVLEYNKYGFTQQQQNDITKVLSENNSVIGATDYNTNPELAKYLNDAGSYFLYTFLTESQAKQLPYVFQRKRTGQKAVYNYCKNLYVPAYGDENAVIQTIRAGIIKDFKQTPEEIADYIVQGKGEYKIGVLPVVIEVLQLVMSIIELVAGFVINMAKIICNTVEKVKVAKYQSLNNSAIKDNAAAGTDYGQLFEKSKKQTSKSKIFASSATWWVIGALGLGLLFSNIDN